VKRRMRRARDGDDERDMIARVLRRLLGDEVVLLARCDRVPCG